LGNVTEAEAKVLLKTLIEMRKEVEA
jgi:hypothetical protein